MVRNAQLRIGVVQVRGVGEDERRAIVACDIATRTGGPRIVAEVNAAPARDELWLALTHTNATTMMCVLPWVA